MAVGWWRAWWCSTAWQGRRTRRSPLKLLRMPPILPLPSCPPWRPPYLWCKNLGISLELGSSIGPEPVGVDVTLGPLRGKGRSDGGQVIITSGQPHSFTSCRILPHMWRGWGAVGFTLYVFIFMCHFFMHCDVCWVPPHAVLFRRVYCQRVLLPKTPRGTCSFH